MVTALLQFFGNFTTCLQCCEIGGVGASESFDHASVPTPEAIRAPGTSGMQLAVADRRLSGDTTKLLTNANLLVRQPSLLVRMTIVDVSNLSTSTVLPVEPLTVTSRCSCCKSVAMRRASYSRGEIDTRSSAHYAYAASDTINKIE
jgi:hypothetical protein